jgi:hypothetical protein
MQTNQSTSNNIITFISKHLTLLILFPTFLGGCVQFIILALKSFTLLLYFSPTQVLTDGIALLVLVPLFLLGIFLSGRYHEVRGDIKKRRRILILLLVFMIILVFLMCLLFFKQDYKMLGKVAYLAGSNFINLWLFNKNRPYLQTFNKKASFVLAISIVLSMFFNVFTKPNYDEISGIRKLNIEVNKKYPGADLIYCNDKYLFYDKYPSDIKTVDKYEIVSTDHLFLEHYGVETKNTK